MAESADPMELAGQIAPRYTEDGLWVARCAHDTTIDMFDGPQASSRSPCDRGMTEANERCGDLSTVISTVLSIVWQTVAEARYRFRCRDPVRRISELGECVR